MIHKEQKEQDEGALYEKTGNYPERAAVQKRLWLSGNGLLPGVMKGIANDRFDARRAQNRLEKRRTPCSDQRLGFLAYRGTLHRRAAAMDLLVAKKPEGD